MIHFIGKKSTFFILLSLLMAGAAFAQETTGGIRGEVADPTGAVIPGATVEIVGPALMNPQVMKTNATGAYGFLTLPPGVYSLSVTADGFTPVKRMNIDLQVGKIFRVDFRLEVGAATQTVEVVSEAAIVDVSQATIAANVTASAFDRLPKTRGFSSLIALAPGARREDKTGGFQVDGASGSENVFVVDGMDMTNIEDGTLHNSGNIPTEFVQELQVKSSGFQAEYGGAMGGVINVVTKSGSNEFHGDVGMYFQNGAMQARPRPSLIVDPEDDSIARYQQNETDAYRYLNPGFTLGGPIMKNRLWFFAGYYPELKKWERPVTFLSDDSSGVFDLKTKRDYLNGKIDFAPSTKLRTYFGYIYAAYRELGELPARDGSGSTTRDYRNLGGRWPASSYTFGADYTLTPRLILSARGGYHYNNHKDYGVPRVPISVYQNNNTSIAEVPSQWRQSYSGYTPGYDLNDQEVKNIQTRFRTNADLSYIFNAAGQHTLKTGYEINRLHNDRYQANWPDGYLRFYWNATYNGQTSRLGESMRGTYGYLRHYLFGTTGNVSSDNQSLFVQDSWQVTRQLTVQAGLRTEREYLPSYVTGPEYASDPIKFGFGSKLAPRLGFAYDVLGNAKWKIAGSFGLFYDLMKYSLPRGSFGGDLYKMWFYPLDNPDPAFYISKVQKDSNGLALAEPLKDLPLWESVDYRIKSNDKNDNRIDPDLKPMRRRVYDFSTDFALTPTMVFSARYTHNSVDRVIEDVGTLTDEGERYYIANPGFGITVAPGTWGEGYRPTPKAKRNYDALELRLDKRFANNYYFSTSYTLSRLYGNFSGLASSDEVVGAAGEGRTDPNASRYFDLPWMSYDATGKLVEGRLATDRPHALKFYGAYTLKSKLGETNFGPNFVVMSGTPVTTEVTVMGSTPVYVNGRGDLGRTPVFSQTDFMVYHEFKIKENKTVRFDLDITNLFNQSTVTDIYTSVLHQDYQGNNLTFDPATDFFKGFAYRTMVEDGIAAGELLPDPRYNKAWFFQGPRTLRLGVKFIF